MLTDRQTDRRTDGETFANPKLLSELKKEKKRNKDHVKENQVKSTDLSLDTIDSRLVSTLTHLTLSFLKTVGCGLRWNFYANRDIPECDSIIKIQEHQEFQKNMSLLTENEFIQVSGCQRPCSYYKYKVVSSKGVMSFDGDGDIECSNIL